MGRKGVRCGGQRGDEKLGMLSKRVSDLDESVWLSGTPVGRLPKLPSRAEHSARRNVPEHTRRATPSPFWQPNPPGNPAVLSKLPRLSIWPDTAPTKLKRADTVRGPHLHLRVKCLQRSAEREREVRSPNITRRKKATARNDGLAVRPDGRLDR